MLLPEVFHYPQFFQKEEADIFFLEAKQNIHWQQHSIKIFGREVLEPRLVAWYGDKPYTYSGKTMAPLPWDPFLLAARKKIEDYSGSAFNTVLLNFYRNGNDSMGWHSDGEPELGTNPVIASLNFGEAREFQLRNKKDKSLKVKHLLQHGDLLLMKGSTQHYWQHQVPKSKTRNGERINLTFRLIR